MKALKRLTGGRRTPGSVDMVFLKSMVAGIIVFYFTGKEGYQLANFLPYFSVHSRVLLPPAVVNNSLPF